jgi:hypothetical protein
MFNYNDGAELYFAGSGARARRRIGYRRFARAAAAIQFAIEQLPPATLQGAFLEVGEERFGAADILLLYEHADFPLRRRAAQ